MPSQLLPASAAAFAPRASTVNVVLGAKAEPWLTQTLKRINRVKRPLNNVAQHQRCLTETLSMPDAIWVLASLMLPAVPRTDMQRDDNPLIEALVNFQLIHIKAYVVHVDMVLRNEVAFKLSPSSIAALVEYHKDVHCVDAAAETHDWAEKEGAIKRLKEDFVQAINKFVYRAPVAALEGLEEDGVGELLSGRSDDVKRSVMELLVPLLPPPPRVAEPPRSMSLLSASPSGNWWSDDTTRNHLPAPIEPWRVVGSSPGPGLTQSAISPVPEWQSIVSVCNPTSLHSLGPTYSQPYAPASLFYGSSALSSMTHLQLPLPSTITQQPCGIGYGSSLSGFGWHRSPDFAMTM